MAATDIYDGDFVAGVDAADEDLPPPKPSRADPDEFFSKHAFRVVYQTNNFLLPQLRELIKSGDRFHIRPDYQRRLRWTTPQKSKLIESLLLNIPVPPIFLYESDEARYEVMDGQQRLNAVKEFIEGDFALSTLEILTPLNGLRYSKFPPRVKRALDRASLSAIVLLLESDSEIHLAGGTRVAEIRRFIFDRLNTGGARLNPQEIRNNIYPGHFSKVLVEASRDPLFTKIFQIPPHKETSPSDYYESPERQRNQLYATMGDCQLVLRYFALRESSNIRGSMKSMLDRAMESRMGISRKDADDLKDEYLTRLEFAADLFGPDPFLLPPDDKGVSRLSAALYDASLVAVNRVWKRRADLEGLGPQIRGELEMLYADAEIAPVLTGQGNTAKAVRDRIDLLEEVLLSAMS